MRNQRGFSLIEVVMVCVVAGLIIAIGLPAFGNYNKTLKLKQARTQILEDLRSARQFAITRRSPVWVRFGTPPTLTNITTYTIHIDTNNDKLVNNGERFIQRTLPSYTKIASMTATTDTLCFDISGILVPGQTGGTIVLTNTRNALDTLVVSAAGIAYHP